MLDIPTSKGTHFSTSSPTRVALCVCVFNHSQPRECEALSHCSVDFHFPKGHQGLTSFYVPIGCLYTFFGFCSNPLPIFNLGDLCFYY